jgi:uncharacterized protein (TIGR02611 family)
VTDDATHLENDGEVTEESGRHHGRLYQRLHANRALALTTKIVVTVVGSVVALAGVVMIFTPGQGVLAIILGLAILATEYEWADRWLKRAKEKAADARRRAEAMDPKVRRRRMLLGALGTVVVIAAIVAYLVTYGWPSFAVGSWNWLQSLVSWVPELPGM